MNTLLTLDTTQKVPITIAARTKNDQGNVEIMSVIWSRVSGDGTVVPGPGSTATLVSGDAIGETVFRAMVQGNFGDGVITAKQDITMTVVEAGTLPEGASITVTVGSPVPK
jgi:hypothetical protein